MMLLSIQLSSNRPYNIQKLLDNIEATADAPEQIELLVHIDTGDRVMENLLISEQGKRKVSIRYLQTDWVKKFSDLWKVYNPLFQLTHKDAYFVTLISDEMRFDTQSWDKILTRYIDYYPDGIFRLRCSRYRFRNYIDFWQCGFSPDSIAFYTRRWLAIQGDWNPCSGPDTFQQCVSYYMFTYDPFSPRQFYRDIAVPNLSFSGEGVNLGLDAAACERRLRENNRSWFILMSHKMQQEAARRAKLLMSHIISYANGGDEVNVITNDIKKKTFIVINKAVIIPLEKFPYKLSWVRVTSVNILRAPLLNYFCGGGYIALRHDRLDGIRQLLCAYCPQVAMCITFFYKVYIKLRITAKKIQILENLHKNFYIIMRRAKRRLFKILGIYSIYYGKE